MDALQSYYAPQPHITVLGVEYLHLQMPDGEDLYLTEYGLPLAEWLLPENHWGDSQWRKGHRERLLGSSSVFRMATKPVCGRALDIVLKWNRMGQDVPGETAANGALDGAEFNSPFMEFSLLREMRDAQHESLGRIYTHKPLAIYVPRSHSTAEQLGRRQHRMDAIDQAHNEFNFDWNRTYAVIYEWLKGLDAAQAFGQGLLDREGMVALYERANRELFTRGYAVRDNKPRHVIVRPRSGGRLARDKSGEILYGLVDFELLERTKERDELIRAQKRREYLVRQAHRFEPHADFPPGLTPVTIMGVDYVYGEVESTGGALWVVGRDWHLFDYFLPEKWRKTPRTKLAASEQVYKTVTKDSIHFVWRVSRVGERPDVDPFLPHGRSVMAYGYNSPFEEFSIAMELSARGIPTKYPRAIYMTGHTTTRLPSLVDRSRYQSHADLVTPQGNPILSEDRDYITILGYWNAPDDALAVKDEFVYEGIDALTAYRTGHLAEDAYLRVMEATKRSLAAAGIEDLSLSGQHLLLSLDKSQRLALGEDGLPIVRIRNFELLKRHAPQLT